jgi:hypothetical protein
MGLVEVTGVLLNGREPILNVLKHQVVLWFFDDQSRLHIAED